MSNNRKLVIKTQSLEERLPLPNMLLIQSDTHSKISMFRNRTWFPMSVVSRSPLALISWIATEKSRSDGYTSKLNS